MTPETIQAFQAMIALNSDITNANTIINFYYSTSEHLHYFNCVPDNRKHSILLWIKQKDIIVYNAII